MAAGKLVLGRSDIEFMLFNAAAQSPNLAGLLGMSLRGRVVPNGGGLESPISCSALFNVTSGSALGVVSAGTDSLMPTAGSASFVAPAALPGATLGGAQAGRLAAQQAAAAAPAGNAAAPARWSAGAALALGLLAAAVAA
ncbi:hypothetical protein HT031_006720 [Scenedesmus sp. PABB004]|nr:hypothetical protein HT031_006720 [Scenedesmus sp. PABB004]